MRRAPCAGVGVATVLLAFWSAMASPPAGSGSEDAGGRSEEPGVEAIWANAACYVCHTTFVKEELSRVHVHAKTVCIDCHGLSAGHANDENVGATPPDVTFKRSQIDASCGECHESHDVPAKAVVRRWLERAPKRRRPVCTDCHGTHKIEEAAKEHGGDAAAPWACDCSSHADPGLRPVTACHPRFES